MAYCILRQDIVPKALSVRASDALDLIELRKGALIDGIDEPVKLELGDEELVDSDFIESPYFIVSDKMRLALEAFGIDNIQYFETVLVDPKTAAERSGYWLGNVVGVIKCVDEAKSKFKKLSGKRTILRNFALVENAASALPLFRLGESKRLVMISDALKSHLEDAGLEGLYLQDPTEFNGKPASSFW